MKRFNITESEKESIRKMYGVVTEQESTTPEAVKISLISPNGEETVLWDGTKQIADSDLVWRIQKREMNMQNPTGKIDNSNLRDMLAFINGAIRENGKTEFGEKYKVERA